MDVYHKILIRMFELTKGKETVDVDMVDLLKKEGFYPSLDNIVKQLLDEGWATESRVNILRITHWGVAEARKTLSGSPEVTKVVEKAAKKLASTAREFLIIAEEFNASPNEARLKEIVRKNTEIADLIGHIKENI